VSSSEALDDEDDENAVSAGRVPPRVLTALPTAEALPRCDDAETRSYSTSSTVKPARNIASCALGLPGRRTTAFVFLIRFVATLKGVKEFIGCNADKCL
jgi:hypothetical protein